MLCAEKAHVKGDGKLEYDVCTYHTRLEEALAEAVRRGLREGRKQEADEVGAAVRRTPAVEE